MIENITGYLVLTAIFFLLFLLSMFLFEQYRERIQPVLKKKYKPLTKFPWDTVIKGLAAAGFILFTRKLIYYVPFLGVIQTKSSIWWLDDKVPTFLCCTLFLVLYVYVSNKLIIGDIYPKSEGAKGCLAAAGVPIFFLLLSGVLPIIVINFELGVVLFFFTPMILLKMLVSGKYLGIFTSFVVGYFIINRYNRNRLKFQITLNNAKLLIVPGLVLLVLMIFNFFHFPGDWQKRLNNKVLSVTDENDMVDLLDAVNSINQEQARYDTHERIVSLTIKQKRPRWQKEIYQRVIDAVKDLPAFWSTKLLRKIALWIAGTGDIPWATAVAEKIPDMEIKDNMLTVIREKIEKK